MRRQSTLPSYVSFIQEGTFLGVPQSRGLGTASLLQSLGSKKDALLTIQCPAKVTKVSAAGKTDCCGSTFIKLSFPSTKALRQNCILSQVNDSCGPCDIFSLVVGICV